MAKAAVDLRSLARSHTEMGLRVLCGIAQNSDSDAARVRAVELIWERGWGKAPQSHTGADGEGDIRVIVRHIVNGRDIGGPVIENTPRVVIAIPERGDDE